MLHYRK